MLQEIIVTLQQENEITICICDHQARDLLSCVDVAMILNNCKVLMTTYWIISAYKTNFQLRYFIVDFNNLSLNTPRTKCFLMFNVSLKSTF